MIFDYLTKKDKPIILEIWKRQKDIFGIPFNDEIDGLLENNQFLCAKDDGKIIAICAYKIMKRVPEIRICHLWVAKKYRKQNIATVLIANVIDKADDSLPLTACCKDGAENNHFYERYAEKEYEIFHRKTLDVRKYYLDKNKFVEKREKNGQNATKTY